MLTNTKQTLKAAFAMLALLASCSCTSRTARPDDGSGGARSHAARDFTKPTVEGAQDPVDFTLSPEGDRVALLLGVSKYERERDGFDPLRADQDHEVMTRALGKQGFVEGNIVRLHDAQATRGHVLDAMERMATQIESSKTPIELAVVYYAGHGQQVTDQNGDEDDGYDEALVLWGAHAEDPDGHHHLRDDDFGAALVRLQRALGPKGHLLVVMDMCHSGQSSRSGATVRGGVPPAGLAAKTAKGGVSKDEASFGFEGSGDDALATRVVLSAARADQPAREIQVTYAGKRRSLGALTYALVRSLDTLSEAGTITYRDLYADIVHIVGMKSRPQTPQLEGRRNLPLFGGKYAALPTSFSVDKALGGGRFRVGAGRMVGLDVGAKVSLYPPGSDPKTKRFAVARVEEADELESTLVIEAAPKSLPSVKTIGMARIVVDEPIFTGSKLGVAVEREEDRAFLNESAPFLRLDEGSDYTLRRVKTAKGKESLLLEHITSEPGANEGDGAKGKRVFSIVVPDEGFANEAFETRLLETLRAFAQLDFVGTHTSRDARLSARLDLQLYDTDTSCKGSADSTMKGPVHAELNQGVSFRVDVTNTSATDAYVYVVLMASDHTGYLLYPPPNAGVDTARTASEKRVHTHHCVEASTPDTEHVRAFVSARPLMLTALFEPEGMLDLDAMASSLQIAKSAAQTGPTDPRDVLGEPKGPSSRGEERSRGLTISNLPIEIVAPR